MERQLGVTMRMRASTTLHTVRDTESMCSCFGRDASASGSDLEYFGLNELPLSEAKCYCPDYSLQQRKIEVKSTRA